MNAPPAGRGQAASKPSAIARWLGARTIRARIVFSMLALLPPAAALAAWLIAGEMRQARAAADAQAQLLARAVGANVQAFVDRAEGVLARLAARPEARSLDPAACQALLGSAAPFAPFAAITLHDVHGAAVCSGEAAGPSAPRFPADGPAPARRWFREALTGAGFGVGRAIELPAAGGPAPRWVAVLSHPVRDPSGNGPVGLLALPLALTGTGLAERLLAGVPPGSLVAVVDGEGTVLLRVGGAVAATVPVGTRPAALRGAAAGSSSPPTAASATRVVHLGGDDREGEGTAYRLATVPIAAGAWQVVAALPEAELEAAHADTVRRAALTSALLALIGLALAWRLSLGLARPVAGLARAAGAAAAGDTRARAPVDGPDEVATVARQFNRVLDARDAAEAALRESEERYRTLVDWSPEALSVHRDGKVLFVNRATVQMLGARSADELVGHASIEIVHPAWRAGVDDTVLHAIEQDRTIGPHEQQFVRRDGTRLSVEVQGTRIVFNGRPALIASVRDISERKRVEAALHEREAQLRRLLAVQDRVQEDERRRIARELHDDLQQTLAAIRMNLRAADERLRPDAADAAGAQALLAEVDQLAGAAIVSTRRIVNDLRPPMLEDLGLVPALEALAAQFSRHAGIECEVHADGDAGDDIASPAEATSLYRVAQEALNNVLKHARATRVEIHLAGGGEGVTLTIHDDGVGFDAAAARKPLSFGLPGMHERIRALGGRLRIDSRPGEGTTITVALPGGEPPQEPGEAVAMPWPASAADPDAPADSPAGAAPAPASPP